MDVTEETFAREVLERSDELPVVVDFFADWCKPCQALTPVLEQAVADREVVLVKVDVDTDKQLADRYQVSGIPAVKAFRRGEVVAEFVGARSRPAVDLFLDELTRPPVADSLTADDELAATLKSGDYEAAFELLLRRAADPAERNEARRVMVELFNELGQTHPLATAYRKRLAALLY